MPNEEIEDPTIDPLDNEIIEICISCGATTRYLKTDNIQYRRYYIQGIGQLCFSCGQTRKMHKQGSYETSDWERYG